MITRQEHLEWCKKRALEYVENGDFLNAITSMLSDLGKHLETKSSQLTGGMLMLTVDQSSKEEVRRFIEGFN